WDTRTGKLLQELDTAATEIAFSPDGKLLAAGDVNGLVKVWALALKEPLMDLNTDRVRVESLAFARDVHRSANVRRKEDSAGWLLAVGTAGGLVTIWDVETRQVRCF